MVRQELLRMEQICKAFPGVQALKGVDFDLQPGEVHGLVGENGAGKSTLMKILAGIHRPDAGRVLLRGTPLDPRSPRIMQDAGIRVIHQELNAVPGLSVAENLFLGQEPLRWQRPRVIDWRTMYARTAELLEELGWSVDPRAPLGKLGVAQRQLVEIARAVSFEASIVVMDEPTASLTTREVEQLFSIIARLQARQAGIIYISHRLEEIRRLAHRVTVLRDGRRIVTAKAAELTTNELIGHMVGRGLTEQYPKEQLPLGPVLLEVDGLTRHGVCQDVSFRLRAGEIVGMAGLAGAGRTEIAELVFGRRRRDGGSVRLEGREIRGRRPRDAVRGGIGLIPEERKTLGLVLGMSVLDNAALAALPRFSAAGWIRRSRLASRVEQIARELRIKATSAKQAVKYLSGGNQQKVVLARWLLSQCRVYLFDEPTRGVDVAGKREIYRILESLAQQGAAILMISSDLPEVLSMSDRILVVRAGRIVKELARGEATQETVLRYAVGQATTEMDVRGLVPDTRGNCPEAC